MTQVLGAQPDVPPDPDRAGYTQYTCPSCLALSSALSSALSPQPLAACFRAWRLSAAVWVLLCWRFLRQLTKKNPKEIFGKGLAVEKCLALSFPSSQFLAAWGQGTPWPARWGATVQDPEN